MEILRGGGERADVMTEPAVSSLSLEYLEGLYAEYLTDPAHVPRDWGQYFAECKGGNGKRRGPAPALVDRSARRLQPSGAASAAARQERLDQLIDAHRVRGHRIANTDPLELPRPKQPELDLRFYGFTEADLDQAFSTHSMYGAPVQTLRAVLDRLHSAYCGYVGVEFMHIDDLALRDWLQQRLEDTEHRRTLSRDEQLRILTRLTDAVIFEEFVRRKYVGAKTFSLEGAESLIPLLDLAIEKAGAQGIQEIVMAMAHRGRLNVLANIIGKRPQEIFREFADAGGGPQRGKGDVKYHLGHHNDWLTAAGQTLHLTLCPNPSHLEFVNPVAMGLTRAKQDRRSDQGREQALTLLIHGDAAFAGEGIVQESLNLSQLQAYATGGALHVILNNQIGFTTPPAEGRSGVYTSDVAKLLQAPIFHVNGEHPEAVAQVVHLAMDFRRAFHRDVFIDMYCYRRWGHSEGDDPSFTQPLLYRAIARRKSVRDGYLEHLLKLGKITQDEADRVAHERQQRLEEELARAKAAENRTQPKLLADRWKDYAAGERLAAQETAASREQLVAILESLVKLPAGFHLHRKLQNFRENRRAIAAGERAVDWSTAEALALASLAMAGYRIRLSGQDSARGTFSQRHAVWHDAMNGQTYAPLQHVAADQAPVEVFNSPLSEAAVLGFEYGYSLGYPDALVLWEAQFGDFANAAQVLIDQFLASGESKWRDLSGLALLLPHGFEGQGPEHSSARLERFLQLAADDNLQIVVPSTPAQYFHCLRRQALARRQKPLVLFTPKSLLRHPRNVSDLDQFSVGSFQEVLPDPDVAPNDVERILLCSGKIYYELLERCEKAPAHRPALVRLEQVYPPPQRQLATAIEAYREGTPVCWVQEEPENMGAWRYVKECLGPELAPRFPLSGVFRPAASSPAGGSASNHRQHQRQLLDRALGEQEPAPMRRAVH